MAFDVRRVVTGHNEAGRPVIRSDGRPLAAEALTGVAVAELLWLDGAPVGVDDGRDRTEGGFPLEPPPGGLSVRVIRLPAPSPGTDDEWVRVAGDDPAEPGMHATDTLDVVAVIDGEIVLGLDDGEHHLGAGDVVVQRGTRHRWRVGGDRPCTYAVFMVRPDPGAPGDVVGLIPGGEGALGPRRLVASADGKGSSYASSDGRPPCAMASPGGTGTTVVDLWQTGGPLADVSQGGDSTGPWELNPAGGGVAFRFVEMQPGHDPGDRGWHATPTIDVDLVLSGQLELALPDVGPVVVGPRSAVVQRGTTHKWRAVGDAPVRYVAIMLSVAAPQD